MPCNVAVKQSALCVEPDEPRAGLQRQVVVVKGNCWQRISGGGCNLTACHWLSMTRILL